MCADQHPQAPGVLEQIQKVIAVLNQITGAPVCRENLQRLDAFCLELFKLASDCAVVTMAVDTLMEGVVNGHLACHLLLPVVEALKKILSLVMVCKINYGGHTAECG